MTMPRWGTPPWRLAYRPPPAAPPARCEVAVVGAGFTGLSTALHLAARGVRVAVLEAAHLGAGASGCTGGIPLEGTAVGALPGVMCCLETLARVVAEHEIACDLRLDGCWELSHRGGAGVTPLWTDDGQPLGIATTVPGGTVDPAALVDGLARAAVAAGATVCEGARVVGVESGPPVTLALADATRVVADHLVLALNAFTPALVPAGDGFAALLTLGLCTAPLPARVHDAIGLGAGLPFYTADLPYLWGRPTRDGSLILGAGLVPLSPHDPDRVGMRDPEVAAAFTHLETRVRRLHPALAEVTVTHRWGGPIAFRASRRPLLGRHPDLANVIVTGACAGHGIALGVRVGEMVAEAVVGNAELPAWGRVA
ncbi:MAG: FAD-binding oxidoreductase [bacterium]|nr:FAD-binding oxidoreductase [bacterium]